MNLAYKYIEGKGSSFTLRPSLLRPIGFLALVTILLAACNNNAVYTKWYAFPPEESVFEGERVLLAGVSKQPAPFFSLDLDPGTLVVVTITSPTGEELARREANFPRLDDVQFVGRWDSVNSFSVEVYGGSSDSTSASGQFIASLHIDL